MGAADLDVVAELEPVLFGRDAWSRQTYAEELGLGTRRYVVAVADGTVVGYAGIDLAAEAQVMTVGVVPGHRRRGVATAMMTHLVGQARAAGARSVLLEVRAGDAGAQTLYRGLGFAEIGVRRGYYQHDREDAVVMRLRLTPATGPVGSESVVPDRH